MNIKEYLDKFGRMDLTPVNGGEPSTNNNLLYSGELAILMKLVNDKKPQFSASGFIALKEAVLKSRVAPGLYSRHPEPYRLNLPKQGRPTSFDEITGASFVFGLTNTKLAEEIVQHGELNYWQYCDVPKFEKGKPLSSMFSKGLFKDLVSYYKEAKSYEKDGFRKASQNYPRFYPLFFQHSHSSRIIYRTAVGYSPTFANSFFSALALLVASLKKDNVSTRVLWFFRLKHLEIHNQKPLLVKLAEKLYNRSNKKMFGNIKELFRLYYKDANHPFHKLIEEI